MEASSHNLFLHLYIYNLRFHVMQLFSTDTPSINYLKHLEATNVLGREGNYINCFC